MKMSLKSQAIVYFESIFSPLRIDKKHLLRTKTRGCVIALNKIGYVWCLLKIHRLFDGTVINLHLHMSMTEIEHLFEFTHSSDKNIQWVSLDSHWKFTQCVTNWHKRDFALKCFVFLLLSDNEENKNGFRLKFRRKKNEEEKKTKIEHRCFKPIFCGVSYMAVLALKFEQTLISMKSVKTHE